MKVIPIPQLRDNYAYLVIDRETKQAAVIDCAEAGPVLDEVERQKADLVAILPTHHHFDHVGGNNDLLRFKPLRVIALRGESHRIPGANEEVDDGGCVAIGNLTARVLFIPAHTSGHVAYYFERPGVLFTGDTLFAGGCGRLFEGDAATMLRSLERLSALPPETQVYCGHEYTQKNLEFALTLEPHNRALQEKYARVLELRRHGLPTVPTTIAEEKATNPFLRCWSEELRATVRRLDPTVGDDIVAVFAKVRALKDVF